MDGFTDGFDIQERIARAGEHPTGWVNMLFRGDNRRVLEALQGPLRNVIAAQGGLKLIYIDPPFDVGADFHMAIPLGDASGTPGTTGKAGKAGIQTLAYRDIWGPDAYFAMLRPRLALMHDLLAPDGTIFVHCDHRVSARMRLVLDALFKTCLNEIVWHYTGGGRAESCFSRKHDTIFWFAKGRTWTFNADDIRVPYKPTSGYARSGITSAAGKRYTPNPLGTVPDDVWDIPIINPLSAERVGYPTQKPEALLERILRAASSPGDLVADFFCGSGTTPAVATKLGRKWIAADCGALAVHTTRKRLMRLMEAAPAPAFDLLTEAGPHAAGSAEPSELEPTESRTAAPEPCPSGVSRTADLQCALRLENDSLRVELTHFSALTSPEAEGRALAGLQPGSELVLPGDSGLVKLRKDKQGVVSREACPGSWVDCIDLWAVDTAYGHVADADGDPIFAPVWWACRSRRPRPQPARQHDSQNKDSRKETPLPLCSPCLPLPAPSPRSSVVVQVVDGFGNTFRTRLPLPFPSHPRPI